MLHTYNGSAKIEQPITTENLSIFRMPTRTKILKRVIINLNDMNMEVNLYDGYVIRNILANDQFNIEEVNNLESIKSIYFFKEEYPIIERFIKDGNIEAIKTFSENKLRSGEYLDVMVFNDENEKKYIVTVYDSDMLEQDPQVIEVYPLEYKKP